MSHLQEKLEIARELGLTGYISAQEAKVAEAKAKEEREAVIQELTAMKFKPITMKEIGGYFPKWKWVVGLKDNGIAPIFFGFGVFVTVSLVFSLINTPVFPYVFYAAICGFIVAGGVSAIDLKKVQIASMPLSDWRDELPRGALLAVKEAKERGVVGKTIMQSKQVFLGDIKELNPNGILYSNGPRSYSMVSEEVDRGYTIYYPRLASRQRLQGDPVITGLYKGVEVEIFAWDDHKIRPEDY